MGSFRRSSVLCSVIQGLVIWSAVVAGEQWTVTIPERLSAPVGSCIVVPCSFTPPTSDQPIKVTWYQYVSRGYPLVYSESSPKGVIDKFRDRTEFIGNAAEGNCSLKISPTQATQSKERTYVWIDPNNLSTHFYDQTVTLAVTENAPQPKISVLGTELTEGDVVKLSCDVIHTCPPSPPTISIHNYTGHLHWSHKEEEAGRWCVSVETSWTVSSVDNGRTIVCDVTHPGGLTASSQIVLNVIYPPKSVAVHGSSTVVPPNGGVSLSCSSQANPPADSFQWYRVDGGQARPLGKTSKTVTIKELDWDQNLFRCEATNSVGSGRSSDFEVIKEYKPSISEASNCSFHAGSVSCWCEATARPEASLQWRVEGVYEKASPAHPSTANKQTVSGMWAGKATTEHVNVTCLSRNRHGQSERLLRMYVKAPPFNVVVTQNPSRPREGAGVTLSCVGQGYPAVSGYHWYRGWEGLETRLKEESRDLRVSPATRDSGPYRCTAQNEIGKTSSPVTRVNVEYAPAVLLDSKCIMGNGQLRCECIVDSNPTAKVTWSTKGSLTNEKHNTSSMLNGHVLRSVLTGPMEDEGCCFYCNATNKHGDAFYPLPITVAFSEKWGVVFGVIGAAVPLCLLLGVILYCKCTKRHRKHTDLPLKELKRCGEEEVKSDPLYENAFACSTANPYPTSYELGDTPRYQDLRRQPDYSEDVYQNY